MRVFHCAALTTAAGWGFSSSLSRAVFWVVGFTSIFYYYLKEKKKGRMQQHSGCALHFQTHPKGGEIFPFAIIPPSPPRKEAVTALRAIGPYYSHRVEVPPPEGGGSGNELPHKSMEKCRHETGVTQR